jgi:hypothetical protein
MLRVFPQRKARLEERRAGIGCNTRQSSTGAAGWIGYARTHLLNRTIASVRAASRVKACLQLNSHRVAEGGHLLLPVMISGKPGFAWRFRAITGEIFFARNRSPRAGHAGSTARKFAGRKSPARKCQDIDYIEYCDLKIFFVLRGSLRSALLRSHLRMTMSVLVILRCALFARPEGRW